MEDKPISLDQGLWNPVSIFKQDYTIPQKFEQIQMPMFNLNSWGQGDKESWVLNNTSSAKQLESILSSLTLTDPPINRTQEEIVQNQNIDQSPSSISDDWRKQCKSIKSKLSYILAYQAFPDVIFIVGKEKVKIGCHKLILMIASSALQNLVKEMCEEQKMSLNSSATTTICKNQNQVDGGGFINNCIEINLPHISVAAFEAFLKYIYTDQFEISMEVALDILTIAKTYAIVGLIDKCAAFLKCHISEENVISIYQTANILNEMELYQGALSYIFRHPEKVINSSEFLMLTEENLCFLLECDELKINELDLFHAVYKWGLNKCRRIHLDDDNRMPNGDSFCEQDLCIILKKPIHLIRFPLLTPEQLTIHVAPKNILNDSELLELYKYLSLSSARQRSSLIASMPFSTRRRETRSTTVFTINRLEGVSKDDAWSCKNLFWKVNFMVNRPVLIHGYGFLGSYETFNSTYDVEIQLIGPKVSSVRKELIHLRKPKESFQVKFIKPIQIIGNTWYTSAFTFSGPPTLKGLHEKNFISLHCGDVGRVSFKFKDANENPAPHQLSQLLFSL